MKVYFATTNKGKVEQAKKIFEKHNIKLEQFETDCDEPSDKCLSEIAIIKAEKAFEKLKKPVFADDTGFFLDAYPGFPGVLSKRVYVSIGFEGFFRLLEGKNRRGYFETIVAFNDGEEMKTFSGKLKGAVMDEVTDPINNWKNDPLPYERVFVPENFSKVLLHFSPEEKLNKVKHHRISAFNELAKYLKEE